MVIEDIWENIPPNSKVRRHSGFPVVTLSKSQYYLYAVALLTPQTSANSETFSVPFRYAG